MIADTLNFNLFFFLANACKDSWRGGGAKESKGGARDERRAMREEERKLQRERERETQIQQHFQILGKSKAMKEQSQIDCI